MKITRIIACTATALAAALPASAQQNDYGGYDIVGQMQREYHYSDTRGWHVLAAKAGAKFAYCVAEMDRGDGSSFRIGWDGMQWQIAVPVKSRPDWEGTLQIDGAGSGQGYLNGGDSISGTSNGDWTIAWLGEAELDGIRKGNEAVLGVGKFDYDFSLSGATAATQKVKECVARSGKAGPAAQPAPAAQPMPVAQDEPVEAVSTPFGKAGTWVINEIKVRLRTIACEAYDPAGNPDMRFEIDEENSYIDFKDGSDMGELGERIAIQVGFGPGSSMTDTEVEIIEGRDGDKWARITEGRSDGPGFLDDAIPNANQVSFIGHSIILETHLDGSNKALDLFFRCSGNIR